MALSVFHFIYKWPVVVGNQLYASQSPRVRMTKTRKLVSSIPFHCISQINDKTPSLALKTCKNCKTQYDPALNHSHACRFHTSHFGGETKRKFESVYTGGTMNTPDSGQVFQYWHCCGIEDPCDPGCTASPHVSYDD